MVLLISSPSDLKKYITEEEGPELYEYVRLGYFIRFDPATKKVIYPTRQVLMQKIAEAEDRLKNLLRERARLRRKEQRPPLLLTLRHHLQRLIDPDYRELSDTLNVERLLMDRRGHKIVEQLIKDKEYRERVRHAISGPVYKSSPFGSFVKKTEELRNGITSSKLKKLNEEIEKVEREIDILRRMFKWT